MISLRLPRAALLALAAAAAACADAPTAARPAPVEPVEVARLTCTVHVRAGSFACRAPGAGAASGVIVPGPNGRYVQLEGSNVAYLSGDNVWSADVTVQNLLGQALGTADGVGLDSAGVRVFFVEHPAATSGEGTITILNESGTDAFTASGQAYYQYDELLEPGEVSGALPWEFGVPPEVTAFAFTVKISAAVPFPDGYVDVTPAADTLVEGGAATLAATVRTALGDPAGGAVTWETSDSTVAAVGATGIVSALGPGTATITATSGARSGSATIVVCPAMAVGDVHVADMPEGASLCLAGGASGAEYVVVPVNLADSALSLSVTGAGIVPVAGAPAPSRVPMAGSRFSRGFETARADARERALRLRERRELGPKVAAARGRSPAGGRRAITPGVPAVGALMTLNVESGAFCSSPDPRTGRVVAVGTRIVVLADTTNPSGGLTAADYQAVAEVFDSVVHPAVAGGFDDPATPAAEGTPADIDGNGRVVVFFTRAVNETAPPGTGTPTGGLFLWRDLRSAADCPTSNVGELIYMPAADPAGEVNGNEWTVAEVKARTPGTLAHELQHLVNASRRLHVNGAGTLEETWLDEGLSGVAEELAFYQAAGVGPGADLDSVDVFASAPVREAFFQYQHDNFARLREWLVAPHANGLFDGGDDAASRGAAWAFLRYAADRRGGSQGAFWSALLNSTDTGVGNLETALGTDPRPWIRDFAAAMYADGAGIGAAAPYTLPSWDFRSVYGQLDFDPDAACSCTFPLAVRNPANGVAEKVELSGGGAAAYVRMGVPANAFAGVEIRSGSAAPPATSRIAIIRRK